MKWAQTIPIVLALAGQTLGQAGPWGQCGGIGWSGATTCTSGWYCSTLNPYYSQCLQGTGTVTTTPVVTTTSSRTTTTTSSRTTTTTSSRITTTTRTVTTFTTSSRTTTSSTTTTRPTTTRSDPPPASGTAIRGVSAPIYHKYLQEESGAAILGPEASQAKFVISGGYIRDVVSGNFLNLDTAATTSYKQLSFGTSPTFTGWGLEGDTIITTQGSIYGRQLNYVVCSLGSDKYSLYLQTGSQVPPGTCTNYLTIHLPCLC